MQQVLDHGYVELIETWGSDERIIEAARMSTNKGFLGWGTPAIPGDEKLLRYLWKNKHATPFEMAGATFEVMAPIMVFREWHRHRVPFGYNEMSARYTPLPDVNYIPSTERLMVNAGGTNKQAGTIADAPVLDDRAAGEFQRRLQHGYKEAELLYQWALKSGVPKELARLIVPVGRYSKMRATGNLRGWLGFLALRMEKTAQFEIRVCANVVHDMLQTKFPRTLALFDEGANNE